MKYVDCIYFVGYSFLCCCVIDIQTLCPHPDVPADGKYAPKQSKFEPGDEVRYSCDKGYALSGKDRRICKSNNVWSDHTPFCDHSISLSNPSVTNKYARASSVFRVVDGNSSTCFDWTNATGEYLYAHLKNKRIIRNIKIFIKKGIIEIQIFTGTNNDMKLCADFKNYIETDRWITVRCNNSALANTLKILVTNKKSISICEIEVYGKDEDSCEHPPRRTIPNGYFEVSRSKATLFCEEGYKSNNNRLVCEGNSTWSGGALQCDEILCDPIQLSGLTGGEWRFPDATKKLSVGTRSELVCAKGYRKTGVLDTITCQRNGTWTRMNVTCVEEKFRPTTRGIIFGVVGIVIVLLIISLLATTIHFIRKQRNKEVVVVYQQQSDGSVPLSVSEMEYAVPRYEPLVPQSTLCLPPKAPEPPSTPRPNATFSTSSGRKDMPSEQWKNTLKKKAVSPDLSTFGTMKSSTIYGS